MELLACMIVIAICVAVTEFRLIKRDKKISILQAQLADREWSLDEMHKLGIEAVEEGEVMWEVLYDTFGDEAFRLVDEKKKQIEEGAKG